MRAGRRSSAARFTWDYDVMSWWPVDGLGVVEDLIGVTCPAGCMMPGDLIASARLEACLHPVVKPGPCKGWKGTKAVAPKRRKRGRGPKLTPEQVKEREARIERAMNANFHLSTARTQRGSNGAYTRERDAIHRQIVEDMYAKARKVPREGKAIIAGGLGGAGKTTVLRDHAGVDPSKYFTVNSDDIKEELARRGLIPEVPGEPDLAPMERVSLVHQESSRIAMMLADRAYRDRRNMIWDLTMASDVAVRPQVEDLRRAGYRHIKSVFVDIPVEKSVQRALGRYRAGLDAWQDGEGLGGRFVPPGIIRAQKRGNSTVNRQVFESLKSQFDDWQLFDNSVDGRPPKLVAQKRKAN